MNRPILFIFTCISEQSQKQTITQTSHKAIIIVSC